MNPARRAQLGRKWLCHACGRKFYDLGKEVTVCPSCGEKPGESPDAGATPPSTRGARKKTTRARSKSSR